MPKQLTVTELNTYLRNVIDDELVLGNVIVVGEICQPKTAGGNTFFVLMDAGASINCMMYGIQALTSGTTVQAGGTVKFFAKSGKVTLLVNYVRQAAVGDRHQRLAELRTRLRQAGCFDNRPPMPLSCQHIAIVTSASGAVIHDFCSVAHRRDPSVDITLFDIRVQGEGSADQIVEAIKLLNDNASVLGIDVIVLARGGGSTLDLDSFNTEPVAWAISASRVPVVAAIGHQNDFTLADLAASVRAGTPSIAAELVVRDRRHKVQALVSVARELCRAAERLPALHTVALERSMRQLTTISRFLMRNAQDSVRGLAVRLGQRACLAAERRAERVVELIGRADVTVQQLCKTRQNLFDSMSTLMDKLNPMRLLSSGYAHVSRGDRTVSTSADLAVGDKIKLRFADGSAMAQITQTEEHS